MFIRAVSISNPIPLYTLSSVSDAFAKAVSNFSIISRNNLAGWNGLVVGIRRCAASLGILVVDR